MKFIKAIGCFFVAFSLAFTLSSCSPGDILKELTSGNVDIDDDGNVIIRTSDESGGGEIAFGNTKWDKSKMHGIGAPDAKINGSISSDEGTMYTISELSRDDAKNYIQMLKDEGFVYNSVTIEDLSFVGTNEEGLTITILYNVESGEGSVVSGKVDPPSTDNTGEAAYGSEKEWDSSEVGGISNPGVIITSYFTGEGQASYYFDAIENYMDFVEEIKAAGFTEAVSELEYEGNYSYVANNADGDQIYFFITESGAGITFEANE